MDAVYEMIWDCKYCGQKKLLGLTHRFCAGCGAPQDPSSRYFPPENEKVAVHDHPFVGADVSCPACKHPMSRAAKCCTHCGSPIDKGAEVARRADVVVPHGGAPAFQGADAFAAGRYGPDALPPPGVAASAPAASASASKKGWLVVLAVVGALVAVVVVLVLVAAFWKRDGVFEVTGHAWERSIAVERFDVGRRTAWCDDRPAGGRELSRRREQRSTTQVKDGETCQTRKKDQGNGTYKEVRECQPKYRSEPVYGDRCEFEITEWRPSRTLAERGTSPKDPPRWPTVSLARAGTCLGCEREGARSETYTLKLRTTAKGASGDEATCELPEARWATFAKGSRWKGSVRVLTGGVDCDALVRQ